jgi:mRNA interferase MazF
VWRTRRNNARNRTLPSVLAVRLATRPKPALSSIVEISTDEVQSGRAVCDDVYELWDDEVRQDVGALSPAMMRSISEGSQAALGL